MLIVTRKFGTAVVIGDDIKVTFTKGKGNQVKIAIEVQKDVKVIREELHASDKHI